MILRHGVAKIGIEVFDGVQFGGFYPGNGRAGGAHKAVVVGVGAHVTNVLAANVVGAALQQFPIGLRVGYVQ